MEEKKRILFLHHVSSIGGGSYCLLNLLANIDTTIFKPLVCLKTYGPLVEEIRKLGIDVIFFSKMEPVPYNQSLIRLKSIRSYFQVLISLHHFENIIRDNKIEFVYLNNMMLAPYLFSAKQLGCRTLIHIREHWPLNEHKYQLYWLRQLVYRYCDKLIAINHYSSSIFPEKESTIVYDWIELNNRYREMPFIEIFGEDCSNKKVLLFTGGISSVKGLDYIINSFINYVKGEEYRLLILGGFDTSFFNGWKHNIRCLLQKIGIKYYMLDLKEKISSDYRIKCIPPTYEICHIVEQAYCFVSYFRMPHANLALAECIIMQTPCIAAETEESLEYTNDGEFAMLVRPNNQSLFDIKIQDFLSNIDYWKRKSILGSTHIAKLFSKENNVEQYRKVLSDIVNL